VVAFAWCALAVFTIAAFALVGLLARALFRSIDRVDRIRDEVWSMAKTVETMSVRLERIESGLGQGDQRLGEMQADLRSTMRRDMREILESNDARPTTADARPAG
jgi:hypothetical protein